MIGLLKLFRGAAWGVRANSDLNIVCPDGARAKSFGCRSTFMDRHVCRGHENGRPDYMHRCECGRRWAE